MNPIKERLARDHRELESALEALARVADGSDSEALAGAWADVETRLSRHMQAEERYLLPLVMASHPAAAQLTLQEHSRIREIVAELGLAVELHTIRSHEILALIDWLRAHSHREDEELYAFAGEKASSAVEHGILSVLKSVGRSVLRAAG